MDWFLYDWDLRHAWAKWTESSIVQMEQSKVKIT